MNIKLIEIMNTFTRSLFLYQRKKNRLLATKYSHRISLKIVSFPICIKEEIHNPSVLSLTLKNNTMKLTGN